MLGSGALLRYLCPVTSDVGVLVQCCGIQFGVSTFGCLFHCWIFCLCTDDVCCWLASMGLLAFSPGMRLPVILAVVELSLWHRIFRMRIESYGFKADIVDTSSDLANIYLTHKARQRSNFIVWGTRDMAHPVLVKLTFSTTCRIHLCCCVRVMLMLRSFARTKSFCHASSVAGTFW